MLAWIDACTESCCHPDTCMCLWRGSAVGSASNSYCMPSSAPRPIPAPCLLSRCADLPLSVAALQSPYHVNMGIFCVVLMEQMRDQQLQQQPLSSHPTRKPATPPAAATATAVGAEAAPAGNTAVFMRAAVVCVRGGRALGACEQLRALGACEQLLYVFGEGGTRSMSAAAICRRGRACTGSRAADKYH